jgi:hypothetical protein
MSADFDANGRSWLEAMPPLTTARVRADHLSAALCISIFLIYAAFDQQTGTENLLPKRERNITGANDGGV